MLSYLYTKPGKCPFTEVYDMDENKIDELKKTAENFTLPAYEEIPDVGLFLEQVARYVAKYAEDAYLQPLTGSMISNYVKKKIIAHPVKKMYGRDQIAYLIFIAFAKNVIQIEDMQMLLEIQEKSYGIAEAYEYFRAQMQKSLLVVFGVEREDAAEQEDIFNERAMLKRICITVAHKIYLDSCMHIYAEH